MKRIFCILAALCLLLTACGGAPVQTTAPAETTEPIQTTAPTQSAAPMETTVPTEPAATMETTPPAETAAPADFVSHAVLRSYSETCLNVFLQTSLRQRMPLY